MRLLTTISSCVGLMLFLVEGGGCCAEAAAQETAAKPKMNVVLILADDLGRHDLGCTGSDLYQTPNIDAFAAQSVSFTNAYSSHPTCSPSRAAILSGKYPARLGIVSHGERGTVRGGGDGTFLESEEYTLAEALRDAGYTTCHIGKWHIGKDGIAGPKEQGFEHDIASNEFCCPGSFIYPYKDKNNPERTDSEVPDLEDRGPDDHLTECLAEEAAKFISTQKDSDKPFFLNLWTYAVHTPIEAEKDKVDKYKKLVKPENRQTNPNYAALVEHLDDCVGQVLKAIKDNGLEGNTIVIFASDNGGATRTHSTNNWPLRNGKITQYQGGVGVPLFIRWPGVTLAGAECSVPTIGHDLYPTILNMVNVTGDLEQNAAMDGRDLTPLLRDPSLTTPLHEELHWLRMPVVFHYKTQLGERDMGPAGAVIKGDWKLLQFFPTPQGVEQALELYDLRNDRSETTNVADQYPEIVAELAQAMAGWRKETNAPTYEAAYAEYEKIEAEPEAE